MAKKLGIRSSVLTHPGRKRSHNEDFVAYFEPGDADVLRASGRLYIIADGVGGASEGERASQYAAEKVLYEYYQQPELDPGERLKHAMRQASQEIFEYAESEGAYRRMATTLVAAVVRGDRMIVANVGDSRAYLVRDGEATQITTDHNTVGEMVGEGLMSEEEAMNSKAKNRLTRSLGAEPDVMVDLFPDIQLLPGDKVLLCTDGLTRYALSQNIASFTASGEPEEITKRLVDFANSQGGVDNISVILVEIVRHEDPDETITQPRGWLPTEVGWDSLDTQPVAEQRRKRGRLPWHITGPSNLKKIAVPVTLGVMAIFSIALLAIFRINNNLPLDLILDQEPRDTPTAQASGAPAGGTVVPGMILPTLTIQEAWTITNTTSVVIPTPSPTYTVVAPTSEPVVEITITPTPLKETDETTVTPTSEGDIPEGSWCVYTVIPDGPDTIQEIIRQFTERDPKDLREQVYEATGGSLWNNPWPNGWTSPLPKGAPVALSFVTQKNICNSGGGVIQLKPGKKAYLYPLTFRRNEP
jgi:PPM family protein phosphatase